jgi:DNA-directed RNA polymerase subunit L
VTDKSKKHTKNLTIRLTDQDLERLTVYAESEDITLSQALRRLIRQLPSIEIKQHEEYIH